MKHVMIDLETMGNRAGCAIVSLGAIAFDLEKGILGSTFYTTVELQSCLDVGLKIHASTLYWWLSQSEQARMALMVKPLPIKEALTQFRKWWQAKEAVYLWGHGASFDAPILETAFSVALKEPTPWKHFYTRDTRTLFDLASVRVDRKAGTHHHALDDARAQAITVCQAYKKLGMRTHEQHE